MVLNDESGDENLKSVTIQMKVIEQYFPVVFTLLLCETQF